MDLILQVVQSNVVCRLDRMRFYLHSEDHRELHRLLRNMAARRKRRKADPNLFWGAI